MKSIEHFLEKEFSGKTVLPLADGVYSLAYKVGDEIVRIPKNGSVELYEFDAKVCNFVRPFMAPFLVPDIKIITSEIPYSIHKEIFGRAEDFSFISEIDMTAQDRIFKDYAKLLAALHNISLDTVKQAIPEIRLKIAKRLPPEKCARAFHGFLNPSEIDILISKYAKLEVDMADIVFSHRDTHGKNMIYDDDFRLSGVIDWCSSGMGPPAWDFIRFSNPDVPERALETIIREYYAITGRSVSMKAVYEETLAFIVGKGYNLNEIDFMQPQRESEMNRWVISYARWITKRMREYE
ncbi:MAG: aminoglycoside phosphotransferase family protein [Alphaproteobacteria bacterium]|nr:aminoglycoside phosphotransferase family protein [Alphaproteobacteria bacterium]